jgi:hypothetical protein
LVARQLLARIGPLTPASDAVAVAHAILTAHDAADLALAALAEHLRVPLNKGTQFLMDYVSAIADHLKPRGGKLSGRTYMSQLNNARVSFKHKGNLPHVPQGHAVGPHVRQLAPADRRGARRLQRLRDPFRVQRFAEEREAWRAVPRATARIASPNSIAPPPWGRSITPCGSTDPESGHLHAK